MDHLQQNEFLRLEGIYRERLLTGPRRVTVKLTDKCNYRCIFCRLPREKAEKAGCFCPVDFQKLQELVRDLKFLNTEEIHLSGYGEPFTHPDIYRMIDMIHDSGLNLTVFTNGFFSPARLRTLVKIDRLIVQYSAATQPVFRRIHAPLGDTFDQKKKRIELLGKLSRKHKRPAIHIVFTLTPFNVNDIGEVFDFCAKLGLDSLEFRSAPGICAAESISMSKKEILKLRCALNGLMKSGSRYLHKTNVPQLCRKALKGFEGEDFLRKKSYCYLGWFQCHINLYGEVSPCGIQETLSMGNINKTPFRSIWKGRKARECLKVMKHHFDVKDSIWQKCRRCLQKDTGKSVFDRYELFRAQFHGFN